MIETSVLTCKPDKTACSCYTMSVFLHVNIVDAYSPNVMPTCLRQEVFLRFITVIIRQMGAKSEDTSQQNPD